MNKILIYKINPNERLGKKMLQKKIKLGQFNTKSSLWLKPQVEEFIENANCKIAYDPFAGSGDLLKAAKELMGFEKLVGLDIDETLNWELNDSLIKIPQYNDAIIITNPPYLAKQSASRKKIDLSKYFLSTQYDDVYLIALDKMLESQDNVVAIIPESFLNSSYKQKNRLSSITILEENPFEDTENPVCVACFDNKIKEFNQIKVYKNDKLINTLDKIINIRIEPKNNIDITFNTLKGWLGLRAIDSTDDIKVISFDFKENINYDWENKIKVSSRHLTLIDIDIPKKLRKAYINECNRLIQKIRKESSDILLTPFKGNTKSGIRRRRLDFRLARAIMELAYEIVITNNKSCRRTSMNNLDYFKFSQEHKDSVEEFVKPEGVKVINENSNEELTQLMQAVDTLNNLIKQYKILKEEGKKSTDQIIIDIIDKICEILENKKININYSPFCVYFQVVRYSYSTYKENYSKMELQEKRDLIEYLLDEYIKNRYEMYNYHGYSNMILQVMADASSSRRNSITGIQMLESILIPLGFEYAKNYHELETKTLCYIDSDKKGKKIFDEFIKNKKVSFEFRDTRENKYPDMLIKIKNDYFILEHKLTNGGGGSQNAEINEIIAFTKYDEKDPKIHYVSCLQGDFIQYLTEHSTQPKNITQRTNIQTTLNEHSNNYFVNGKGLEQLLKDFIQK